MGVIGTSSTWLFPQHVAYSKEKKKPPELYCERVSANTVLQNTLIRKLCKIMENNCIMLIEDTSLTGLIHRLKVMNS